MRFKTEVCTFSKFLTEALLWIKEVEMVDSLDESKSSRTIGGPLDILLEKHIDYYWNVDGER